MENKITYKVENNLYINLTNKCTNKCSFCIRTNCLKAYGYDLWLSKEPSVNDVISAADDISGYNEIVFCGYGEPTIKLQELIETGKYFIGKNKKVRLNTNGQGNLINNKNIVPLLKDSLTAVSISLNAPAAEKYQKLCDCKFGESAFNSIIEFGKLCTEYFETTFSVLDILNRNEIEECRLIAKDAGADFRVRKLIEEK